MLVAFSVSPTTTDAPDGSVSEAVARAVRVVRDSGLPYETTSMFTTVEGEFSIGAVRDINADLGDDNTIVFGFRLGECRHSDRLRKVRCNDR